MKKNYPRAVNAVSMMMMVMMMVISDSPRTKDEQGGLFVN